MNQHKQQTTPSNIVNDSPQSVCSTHTAHMPRHFRIQTMALTVSLLLGSQAAMAAPLNVTANANTVSSNSKNLIAYHAIINVNEVTPGKSNGEPIRNIVIGANDPDGKASLVSTARDGKSNIQGAVVIGPKAVAGRQGGAGQKGDFVAIGSKAKAQGDQSTALGGDATASGNSSIAVGGDDLNAVAGDGIVTNKNDTAAAKTYNKLTGDNLVDYTSTTTQYKPTLAGGEASIAFGVSAQATGDLSTAFGTRALTTGVASAAFGVGAYADKENAVALGAGSMTDQNATKVLSAQVRSSNGITITYGDDTGNPFAGGEKIEAGDQVSVGKEGFERQIKNVAPGEINPKSTDAINGSQLYIVLSTLQDMIGNGGGGGTTIINNTTVNEPGIIRYSDASNPTTPNDGTATNDVTLVGGDTNAPVTIHNVGAGRAATDAANVGQLTALGNTLNNKIDNVDKRLRAGVASAMASAGLPQAYLPGKSMVAAAVGYYQGESALAIGASSISDNGKWVIKGTANVNRKDFGVTAGVGYQW